MSTSERAERSATGEAGAEGLMDRLRGLLGLKAAPSMRHDLEDALTSGDPAADFTAEEGAILRNVLGLRDKRADDVMVPRAEVVAVPETITLAALLGVFREAAHSRLPVYGETLDDPKGMVHVRDLVDLLARRAEARRAGRTGLGGGPASLGRIDLEATLADSGIVRPVLYLAPSTPALALLRRMQASRIHIALVIDEFGGVDGLVSMEDVVEAIVGDIADEHDEPDAPPISAEPDGSYLVDARADLDAVSEAVGVALNADPGAEDVDTLGGLVTTLAGRVPPVGAVVPGPGGLAFEVLAGDARRLHRVLIRREPPPANAPPA